MLCADGIQVLLLVNLLVYFVLMVLIYANHDRQKSLLILEMLIRWHCLK